MWWAHFKGMYSDVWCCLFMLTMPFTLYLGWWPLSLLFGLALFIRAIFYWWSDSKQERLFVRFLTNAIKDQIPSCEGYHRKYDGDNGEVCYPILQFTAGAFAYRVHYDGEIYRLKDSGGCRFEEDVPVIRSYRVRAVAFHFWKKHEVKKTLTNEELAARKKQEELVQLMLGNEPQ